MLILVLDEIPTTLGKLSMDNNSTSESIGIKKLSIAFRYILSPSSKTLVNVDCDHSINGIFYYLLKLPKDL